MSGKLNPNVNLVDTLNSGQFTVFAPTDDAFAKIDSATTEKLKTDSDLLTKHLDLPRGDCPRVRTEHAARPTYRRH